MSKNRIGFIGAGFMGYGMAKNLLKQHEVYIIAHQNRKPIDRLVNEGAIEVNSYKDLINHNLDCLMLCVTNTPIALSIAEQIAPLIESELLIIDLTTHDKSGTSKMKYVLNNKNIKYTVNPVMGGPVQSEEGVLGGIWGGNPNDFEESKKYLLNFCKNIFNVRFGLRKTNCSSYICSAIFILSSRIT